MRTLSRTPHEAIGLDIKQSPATHLVGSIAERGFVREGIQNVNAVVHAATLHKPHVATHTRQEFVDTNITGTLNLLEESVAAGVECFIFTSTTSTFGRALTPAPGAPAAWITEDVVPIPKNIYGVTKLAAENLCELVHRQTGMPCIILRTSRFFPEVDDDRSVRRTYDDTNLKVNEFLYRRADVEDIVSAHLAAMEKAAPIGFGRYIITATSPFTPADLAELRNDAPAVVRRHVPEYEEEYRRRGWSMLPSVDRVYVNERARKMLGWQPRYDFGTVLQRLRSSQDFRSPLAQAIGSKGYHAEVFADGPYPV
jgi:nucleoside-diphosphate-sugar epimerase